jgi:hypothetical protein
MKLLKNEIGINHCPTTDLIRKITWCCNYQVEAFATTELGFGFSHLQQNHERNHVVKA